MDGHVVKAGEAVALAVGAGGQTGSGQVRQPHPLDLRWPGTWRSATASTSVWPAAGPRREVCGVPALLNRFPTLCLAVPAEGVSLRNGVAMAFAGCPSREMRCLDGARAGVPSRRAEGG